MKRYYFLIASKRFLLHQEPVEEILRERLRYYAYTKKDIDFFFTTNLEFLDSPELVHLKQYLIAPSAAIVSLNPQFIDWLKLRIQYGIQGSFASSSIKISNNLYIKQ